MSIQIRKHITLFVLAFLLGCLTNNIKAQPGYPANGFVLYFNAGFIPFPDTINSDILRAQFADSVLTIVFTDSFKNIESDSALIHHCRKRIYKIDSSNTAEVILLVYGGWDWKQCCEDSFVKVDTSMLNTTKTRVLYLYTGKLVFLYKGMKKEFLCENFPDGFSFHLGEINFAKPQEHIVLPENINWQNKKESRSTFDLNKYRY